MSINNAPTIKVRTSVVPVTSYRERLAPLSLSLEKLRCAVPRIWEGRHRHDPCCRAVNRREREELANKPGWKIDGTRGTMLTVVVQDARDADHPMSTVCWSMLVHPHSRTI